MISMNRIAALSAVVVLSAGAAARAEEPHPHPHMLHALHELRETHKELKEAKHDFGGHKEAAMKDIKYAIEQVEKALKEDGGTVIPKGFTKGVDYKAHGTYPHLHESLIEMRKAHEELKEAKHDFHGHREEAVKALRKAMEQVEILIKNT